MSTKTFSLNYIFNQAKALIGKYNLEHIMIEDGFELDVCVRFIQKGTEAPYSTIYILLEGKFSNPRGYISGHGCSPVHALNDFEESLIKYAGQSIPELITADFQEAEDPHPME